MGNNDSINYVDVIKKLVNNKKLFETIEDNFEAVDRELNKYEKFKKILSND